MKRVFKAVDPPLAVLSTADFLPKKIKNKKNKMIEKIKDNNMWEKVYLILYALYLTIDMLNTTMFEIKWPSRIGYVQFALVGGYALCKMASFIYLKRYRWYEFAYSIAIIILFTIPAVLTTSYSYLFGIAFLIVGAKDVDFDKILKVYIAIVAVIMVIALIASVTGIIENLQYIDPNKGVRNSFGSIYPTDFGAHIFFLFAAWACLRNKKITWIELIAMLVILGVVYKFCAPVTSTLCGILLVLVCLMNKYSDIRKVALINNILTKIGVYATAIFAVGYLLMQKMYDPLNIYWSEFDHKISLRLYYTYQILQKYSMKLFGQDIEEKGFGRDPDMTHDYVFLDDSYMAIAMKYGLVILIITLIILCVGQKRALNAKRIIIVLTGSVIAMHSFMEHHLLEIAYNPLLLMLFSELKTEIIPKEIGKEKL